MCELGHTADTDALRQVTDARLADAAEAQGQLLREFGRMHADRLDLDDGPRTH